ncbi:MAG TPA: hypothetical protein VI895_08300 [Bdellovibrionota bacterium]|nr:hypothetical protein [Bdellovibrionota bacterium]
MCLRRLVSFVTAFSVLVETTPGPFSSQAAAASEQVHPPQTQELAKFDANQLANLKRLLDDEAVRASCRGQEDNPTFEERETIGDMSQATVAKIIVPLWASLIATVAPASGARVPNAIDDNNTANWAEATKDNFHNYMTVPTACVQNNADVTRTIQEGRKFARANMMSDPKKRTRNRRILIPQAFADSMKIYFYQAASPYWSSWGETVSTFLSGFNGERTPPDRPNSILYDRISKRIEKIKGDNPYVVQTISEPRHDQGTKYGRYGEAVVLLDERSLSTRYADMFPRLWRGDMKILRAKLSDPLLQLGPSLSESQVNAVMDERDRLVDAHVSEMIKRGAYSVPSSGVNDFEGTFNNAAIQVAGQIRAGLASLCEMEAEKILEFREVRNSLHALVRDGSSRSDVNLVSFCHVANASQWWVNAKKKLVIGGVIVSAVALVLSAGALWVGYPMVAAYAGGFGAVFGLGMGIYDIARMKETGERLYLTRMLFAAHLADLTTLNEAESEYGWTLFGAAMTLTAPVDVWIAAAAIIRLSRNARIVDEAADVVRASAKVSKAGRAAEATDDILETLIPGAGRAVRACLAGASF